MNVTINPVERYIYSIDVNDSNYGSSIKSELEQESWTEESVSYMPEDGIKRFYIPKAVGTNSSHLSRYISSRPFKNTLLDLLFSNEDFNTLWSHPIREKFDQATYIYNRYILDKSGYYTKAHMDTRHQILFGMIHFINNDDPDQSTYFSTSRDSNEKIRMSVGPGQGWLCLNNHTAWHEGGNRSNQDRYSMQFGLCFSINI